MKKAFTIVELLMVVAIIGILLAIIVTAAASSIREARKRKADACCRIIEQGFATYYAQEGEWPEIGSNPQGAGTYDKKAGGDPDYERVIIRDENVDKMIVKLIEKAKEGNPMMDISGLFVTDQSGDKARGRDFMDAIRGTKKHPPKMKVSSMKFGYPSADGYFRRFKVVYIVPTDEIKVSR